MRSNLSFYLFEFLVIPVVLMTLTGNVYSQSLNNKKIDGYRGIWFELNQKSEYGDKYSGGLGTYTAKHIPLAIYSAMTDKTFFVYGGTTHADEKYLLCMIGSYDHNSHTITQPVVVHDKRGVDDPHDNPSITMDEEGYIWVFVSGRGSSRPGFKYRSSKPYSIGSFNQVTTEEMTYPQPWFIPGQGIFHFFTKYTGIRELYFETSTYGFNWSEDIKLAGIREPGDERGGHYQVSNSTGNKIVTFFNRHPDGNVDRRTDLYYLQTNDFGRTWTDARGNPISIPLTNPDSKARVINYSKYNRNVYLKDVNFDENGNPACLYVTSGGHEPGPQNDPRKWMITRWTGNKWVTVHVCNSDHNYDMGSLYINGKDWQIIAPTAPGPQKYGTGGQLMIWKSKDNGREWSMKKMIRSVTDRNLSYARRPVNAQDPFYFFCADGNPDEFSISKLYFGNSEGELWELPYRLNTRVRTPIKMNE